MPTVYIGQATSRVDGRAKVTGAAKYAAEVHAPGLVYGYVVSSEIARGRIARIDTAEALRVPGVLQVFTHDNAPRLASSTERYRDDVAPPGEPFRPLHDARIQFSGQPVGLVVADTFELARFAAALVRVEYEHQPHATSLEEWRHTASKPKPREGVTPPPRVRGSADEMLAAAAVKVAAEYLLPIEHHNPIEPFATTVIRDDAGKLTVYDKTQGVQNVRNYLCGVFDVSEDEIRVVSPFVGGAFGSGLRPQYQVFLAVLASRELKRSVRVSLTRQQMFTFGHRPATWQRVQLGAASDGTLEAIVHEAVSETSRFEDYTETVTDWSGLLYRCDNVRLDHRVVRLDLHTPIDMRAPGAVWGVYALECAMDELASRLEIDPVELRLKNHADRDQIEDRPFSSKQLRACYQQGADRFGWSRRSPTPRSMRDGRTLIGWGLPTGVWEAQQESAAAKAVLTADGRLTVSSATSDIGTGTYTIMTQIAAERLGLPLEQVTFILGDSSLPEAPVEGGSYTASSVGSAVQAACDKVARKALGLARKIDRSPLAAVEFADVIFADGEIRCRSDASRSVRLVDALRRTKSGVIEQEASAEPRAKQERYSRYAHSAVFAEVRVDEDFGAIRVARVVTAVAAGRILNPKTARSQVMGAIVGGIGAALEEESVLDHRVGRFVNHNLAEYHVPVNADVRDIDVIFIDEEDELVNPLGAKGLGEIGIVGVAAAIANAVYHATGKRIGDLPITLDKLL